MHDPRSRSALPFAAALALILVVGCAGSKSRLKVGKTVEGEVVEAEGFAANNPADRIQTKRASLVDAQRNAVEKAVGVFVSGRTMVEKAIAIENNILARSEGYVKKYDILSEGLDKDLYKTRIRALVALRDLEADLRELDLMKRPALARPRVRVNVDEVLSGGASGGQTAASALRQSLINQGFVVVTDDRGQADLHLRGSASAEPFQSGGLGGFVSFRARMNLEAVRPGTKDVVVSVTKEASGLGGSEKLAGYKALETVGTLVGDEIGPRLTEAASKGSTLLLFAEDAATFSDVEALRKHLSAQPAVADLMLRSYDESLAQFEVQLNGRASELAATLEASKTFPLKVLGADAQSIRVRLTSAR